jgi:hypothetical protein
MSINNIERSLGRIEGKVESLIVDMKDLKKASHGKIDTLGSRVATIEKKQYSVLAFAGVAFTASMIYLRKFIS